MVSRAPPRSCKKRGSSTKLATEPSRLTPLITPTSSAQRSSKRGASRPIGTMSTASYAMPMNWRGVAGARLEC